MNVYSRQSILNFFKKISLFFSSSRGKNVQKIFVASLLNQSNEEKPMTMSRSNRSVHPSAQVDNA